jgi:carbon storage regulator
MLILSRKKDESIIINGNIEIKVLEIGDGKVRLGIEAPKNIDIFRQELYKSIQEENMEAAKSNVDIKEMGKLFKENGKNNK